MGGRTAAIAVVLALAGASAAQAAPVAGYGEPFATALWSCPNTRSPSDPVVGDHPDAMVRVTFDERSDGRRAAPSIDLGEDPFIWNVTEYYGVTGERWWWPAGTISAGRSLAPMPDCGYDDSLPFTGKAEYFDRPKAPFTFSDPTVRHASSPSILGFVVPQAGEYVADISVTAAQLRVFNPDLQIGDDAQNLGGTWHVDYDAPGTTLRTSLPLGRFEPGLHDLPYQFVSGIHAPGADFSITVRLAREPQPVPAGPPPATPSPTPQITVAGTQRAPSPSLTVAGARTTVRRALRSRLRAWTVTGVSCRLGAERRAACSFTARRRGYRLSGTGAVTLRPSGSRLRYRLTARISRNGCRPVAVSRCSRRTVWSA